MRRSARIAAAAAEKRRASPTEPGARRVRQRTVYVLVPMLEVPGDAHVIDPSIVHDVVGMHDPKKFRSVTCCYDPPSGFDTPPMHASSCEADCEEDQAVIRAVLLDAASALRSHKRACLNRDVVDLIFKVISALERYQSSMSTE